jgi:hypothetical protein
LRSGAPAAADAVQRLRSVDWDANAAVAKASAVPITLDEPICGLDDIARAAEIPNVAYCKLTAAVHAKWARLASIADQEASVPHQVTAIDAR